jgi:hypothetical protein
MLDEKLELAACGKSVPGSGGPWRPLGKTVLLLPAAGRPSMCSAMTELPARQSERSLDSGHDARLQADILRRMQLLAYGVACRVPC